MPAAWCTPPCPAPARHSQTGSIHAQTGSLHAQTGSLHAQTGSTRAQTGSTWTQAGSTWAPTHYRPAPSDSITTSVTALLAPPFPVGVRDRGPATTTCRLAHRPAHRGPL